MYLGTNQASIIDDIWIMNLGLIDGQYVVLYDVRYNLKFKKTFISNVHGYNNVFLEWIREIDKMF